MITSTYSTAAIDLMDSINQDVRTVLSDEAERIARETFSPSIQPEHILEALQRVIRMLQSHQGETTHHIQSEFEPIHMMTQQSRFTINDLPTKNNSPEKQEATFV